MAKFVLLITSGLLLTHSRSLFCHLISLSVSGRRVLCYGVFQFNNSYKLLCKCFGAYMPEISRFEVLNFALKITFSLLASNTSRQVFLSVQVFMPIIIDIFSGTTYLNVIQWEFDSWPVLDTCNTQLQKTQGFCVGDFATLSDERVLRWKIFLLFNTDKRTWRLKIWRAHTFKNLWDFTN